MVAARRIQGDKLVAGREPDVLAIEGDAMHLLDAGNGPYSRTTWACDLFMNRS
jgi:hypothetical protein